MNSVPIQTIYLFLGTGLALNLILGVIAQFRSVGKSLRFPIFALGILLPVNAAMAVRAGSTGDWFAWLNNAKAFLGLNAALHFCLILFIRNFLRGNPGQGGAKGIQRLFGYFWAPAAVSAAALCLLPGQIVILKNTQLGLIYFKQLNIPVLQLFLAIYALFLLENTFRFAEKYQRKIGRLCFISLTVLCVYQIFFFAHILLFRTFFLHYAEITVVIYTVTYPVLLAGFLRYRLGSEKVDVPRDVVFTSATIFLTGAVFLGVAITIFTLKWLEVDSSYFTRFLVGYTFCFFAVLVLGSGNMRKRISRYINEQFYSRKYDYREQFFELHKTMMAGADLSLPATELVENMKYSVTVDDAYLFFVNRQDGNFYLQPNKEQATQAELSISGDSPLVKVLEESKKPLDFLSGTAGASEGIAEAAAEDLVKNLRIDGAFPILNRDELLGILALRGGRRAPFDGEDLMLISAFTNSMGDLLFKNHLLEERIIQKQFESFNNLVSFIIHDVKNQVSTLSLVIKNAEKNLQNPSFQKSMVNSVSVCAKNLQTLIGKLVLSRRKEAFKIEDALLKNILREVTDNSGLKNLEDLNFKLETGDDLSVQIDRQALFFVLKNLIQNALEAMKNRGSLLVCAGGSPFPPGLKERFGGGTKFFSPFRAYILVEDNGPGIPPDFLRDKLFRPFSSSKEKGIGIGLYQCKTWVEQMEGKLLCRSFEGEGTTFCILLK